MANWKKQLEVNAIVGEIDADDAESIKEGGRKIAAYLREHAPEVDDHDTIILDFEDLDGTADDFDDVYGRLCDWADDNRVWLGI